MSEPGFALGDYEIVLNRFLMSLNGNDEQFRNLIYHYEDNVLDYLFEIQQHILKFRRSYYVIDKILW